MTLRSGERQLHLHFVVPGDLDQPTGGYIYDRRIVGELRKLNVEVSVHALRGTFPMVDDIARRDGERFAEAVPLGATVVVDGLALPALYDHADALGRRTQLMALVHHPLFLERDLSLPERQRIAEQEAQALSHCAGVLVPSARTRSDVAALGIAETMIGVVEPGLETPSSAPRGRHSGNGGPLNLLCVGTIIERKGHVDLIEALSLLRDRPWQLDCVGSLDRDPPALASLRAALASTGLAARVQLHGEVSPETLDRLYSRADLFVLTSRHEGYGMALAEAMSYGIPVVSTCAGAIPHTVPEGAGILVPPGDIGAIADALRQLMNDTAKRHAMGRAARAVRRHSWPEAARRFIEAIESVGGRTG